MTPLSKYEQETIINFNAGEDTVSLCTSDPAWMRKLDKLVEKNPEQFKFKKDATMGGQVITKWYEFPKRFVTLRSGDRVFTEEQKAVMAKRAERAREERIRRINSESKTSDNC